MAVDIPNGPTNGQVMIVGTRSWTYSTAATAWLATPSTGGGASTSDLFLLAGM